MLWIDDFPTGVVVVDFTLDFSVDTDSQYLFIFALTGV